MIENVVVFSSIAFAALFAVAWLARRDLRAWVEKPKYRFQQNVQDFDQVRKEGRR